FDESDAHRVYQRVTGIRVVEEDVAGNGGNAEAVSVPADATDDTVEKVPVTRGVEVPEPQGVQERYRPRTHREDVAHDATHPGGRTLVRLDGRRVVVGFNLEGDAETFTNVDHTGVLAGALDYSLAGCWKALQQRTRVLVATVLAPHRAEHAQFDGPRFTAEQFHDPVILFSGKRHFA